MLPRYFALGLSVALWSCNSLDSRTVSLLPIGEETAPAASLNALSDPLLPATEHRSANPHVARTTHAEITGGDSFASRDSLRRPNLGGRVPILEYHLFGTEEGRWTREHGNFRNDLELLYKRGYRPVSLSDVIDRKVKLAPGLSPVVFTFDDASPSQFRYVQHEGELRVDPNSALGIWLDFRKSHPDWQNRAVFCLLSGAEAGRSFFGDKGIEGQKSEWRHLKLRALVDSGFELCNHTVWHANLAKQTDALSQEQIARLNMAVDSAVPGYRIRTFALPLGEWPQNRDLARTGVWRDPRSGREVRYSFDAILMVAGGPARSPHDPEFNPLRLPRVQVFGDELRKLLDQLDRNGTRYVTGG